MLLGAGLGTRLRPLTLTTPKILVPVLGVPLLDRLLAGLHCEGIAAFALNTHHLAEVVRAHVATRWARHPTLQLTLLYEAELLGTGGALVNAQSFWAAAPLLVWNGDLLADVEVKALALAHAVSGALATLVVQRRDDAAQLLIDPDGMLRGVDSPRRGGRTVVAPPQLAATPRGAPAPALQEAAYCGIALLAPQMTQLLARAGAFDLIDALLEVVHQGGRIGTFDIGSGFWGTLGSAAERATLESDLRQHPELLAKFSDSD